VSRRPERLLVLATGLAAALPVVISTVAALGADWVAYGDRAIIALRAHDVLSAQSPLVGQYSSASLPGHPTYSPGPLLYWALALPARAGSSATAVAAGLVNALSVMAAVWLAHRRRGRGFMFAVALALVVMCGSLPEEALHDVWNPYLALLPFTLLILLCWSLARGDHRLLPLTALVASFVVQAHLTLVLPGAALVAIGLVGLARTRRGPDATREPMRRWSVAAAAVALVCWLPPILDQAIHRPGNAVELARSSQDQGASAGLDTGWHAVARTVGVPPWWARSRLGVGDRLEDLLLAPGGFQQATAVLLLATLAAAAAPALRRRDADAAAAGAGAVAVCAALGLVTALTPTRDALVNTLGYTVDWSAPAGMWLYLALGLALAALLRWPARVPRVPAGVVPAAVAVTALVVALPAGDDADAGRYRPIRAALRALEPELGGARTVRVEASPTPLGFDFHAAVVYELRRDGREPVSAALGDRLGGHHRPGGTRPERAVFIRDESAGPAPPGRVAARVSVSLPPVEEGDPPVERRIAVSVAGAP
jgi:hypothetical protein